MEQTAMNRRGSRGYLWEDPDLMRQWDWKGNAGLDPMRLGQGSDKKVWWICSRGHRWQTRVAHRTGGHGCPYCSGRMAVEGVNDLETLDPELAAQWHPGLNGTLTPSQVMPRSGVRVWWLCGKCGHEWRATVDKRSSGRGCPVCARKRLEKEKKA